MKITVETCDLEPAKLLSLDLLRPPLLGMRVASSEGVDGLACSVAVDGVLEPLIVRPKGGGYEVICGLRRFLAAKKAGLTAVPCIIRELTDLEAMEIMLVENRERASLSDYEVGRWLKLLMEQYPDKYPSQEAVGRRFNMSQDMVSRLILHYVTLQELEKSVPSNITPRVVTLPEGFTREVRRAPRELQPKIVKAILEAQDKFKSGQKPYAPSVRDVAAYVDAIQPTWEKTFNSKETEAAKAKAVEAVAEPMEKQEAKEFEKPEQPSPSGDVASQLEETVKKRREKEASQGAVALYKYYPANFTEYLLRFLGEDVSHEKTLNFFCAVIDVMFDFCVEEDQIDRLISEAKRWMEW